MFMEISSKLSVDWKGLGLAEKSRNCRKRRYRPMIKCRGMSCLYWKKFVGMTFLQLIEKDAQDPSRFCYNCTGHIYCESREELILFVQQVHVKFEVTDGLTVIAKLHSSTGKAKVEGKSQEVMRDEDSDDLLHTFKIQHLTPVILTCLLPPSYPSHHPPYFTIYAEWLDDIKISNLCRMLGNVWIEQPGKEVICRWVEWLQSSCLSYLGFDNGITLSLHDNPDTGEDKRLISGSASPELVILSMIIYDNEKCHEAFLSTIHQCDICFEEYPGSKFVMLPCQHFFCIKCMKTYSDIHVKEETVTKLCCPDAKCGSLLPPGLLKRLLGSESYECWVALILRKTLDSMFNVVYCPRCETACLEDQEQHAQCTRCFFSFCSLCQDHRHVGLQCATPEEQLHTLQKHQKSSDLVATQSRRELEILSVKDVLRNAKQCPTCKMAISQTESCNKMVCRNCGEYFCYQCGNAIDGYEHFRGQGGCSLFSSSRFLS